MGNELSNSTNKSNDCEIIATLVPIPMPGPFPFTAWFLQFQATSLGRADVPSIREIEAGGIQETELRAIREKGLDTLAQNQKRLAALEALTIALRADRWEYVGQGRYWYSRKFRR